MTAAEPTQVYFQCLHDIATKVLEQVFSDLAPKADLPPILIMDIPGILSPLVVVLPDIDASLKEQFADLASAIVQAAKPLGVVLILPTWGRSDTPSHEIINCTFETMTYQSVGYVEMVRHDGRAPTIGEAVPPNPCQNISFGLFTRPTPFPLTRLEPMLAEIKQFVGASIVKH